MLSEGKAMYTEHGYRLDPEDTKPGCQQVPYGLEPGPVQDIEEVLRGQAFRACKLQARLLWPSRTAECLVGLCISETKLQALGRYFGNSPVFSGSCPDSHAARKGCFKAAGMLNVTDNPSRQTVALPPPLSQP